MSLTQRQHEVCEMMVLGMSTKEIALRMGTSPRTVEEHRKQVLRKYAVRNAIQLVRVAYGLTETTKILAPQ